MSHDINLGIAMYNKVQGKLISAHCRLRMNNVLIVSEYAFHVSGIGTTLYHSFIHVGAGITLQFSFTPDL